MEILPIKSLHDEDGLIFGALNVKLAKLHHAGISVANGIIVTAPNLHLKVALEHYDFGSKEIFEQSLTLVKKELQSLPIPEILEKELRGEKQYLLNEEVLDSAKKVWLVLLEIWVTQIKQRLWQSGFYPGIADDLEPQVIIFIKKLESLGGAFIEAQEKETVIDVKKGKLEPSDLKKLDEVIQLINKKLILPHNFEWVLDGGIKISKILPYNPTVIASEAKQSSLDYTQTSVNNPTKFASSVEPPRNDNKSTVKVFLDFSSGFVVEPNVDGVFIASEKIFDLNKPHDSFEELAFRVVETAQTYPNSPVFLKLADKSEGMGKVRGALRLIHQPTLLDPIVDVLLFSRNQKKQQNVYPIIPFVRSVAELIEIKKLLSLKKITRNNNYQIWLELAVPENIINLEQYLLTGLDGVVLNLDELISHLSGFDPKEQELAHYKKEVSALLKFLEDGLKLLHKSKVPFIATGTLSLYPEILDFLVEKGVYGIVVERYEVPSAKEILHQAEKKLILRKVI